MTSSRQKRQDIQRRGEIAERPVSGERPAEGEVRTVTDWMQGIFSCSRSEVVD